MPNAIFDILLYNNRNHIISLSLKTTLRERWKQADLEAFALKNVHRKSRSYLITLSEKEAQTIQKKIDSGGVLGLDQVILANSKDLDYLILELKENFYIKPGAVEILQSYNQISSK